MKKNLRSEHPLCVYIIYMTGAIKLSWILLVRVHAKIALKSSFRLTLFFEWFIILLCLALHLFRCTYSRC